MRGSQLLSSVKRAFRRSWLARVVYVLCAVLLVHQAVYLIGSLRSGSHDALFSGDSAQTSNPAPPVVQPTPEAYPTPRRLPAAKFRLGLKGELLIHNVGLHSEAPCYFTVLAPEYGWVTFPPPEYAYDPCSRITNQIGQESVPTHGQVMLTGFVLLPETRRIALFVKHEGGSIQRFKFGQLELIARGQAQFGYRSAGPLYAFQFVVEAGWVPVTLIYDKNAQREQTPSAHVEIYATKMGGEPLDLQWAHLVQERP